MEMSYLYRGGHVRQLSRHCTQTLKVNLVLIKYEVVEVVEVVELAKYVER